MKVRFWGTRGSIASPGAHTIELGGNTACVAVELEESRGLIIDCGTGLIAHASAMMSRNASARGDGGGAKPAIATDHHILVSHFHWDHLLGFPFFHPIHVPGTRVHLYSAFPPAELEEHVRALFDGTYSPLRDLDNLAATVTFHEIPVEGASIAGAHVTCHEVDHSEEAYAIRVGYGSRSFAYVSDHEVRPGEKNDAIVEFVTGCDLLIHDGHFTEEEYLQKVGWGHSSIDRAIDNAVASKVPRVWLTHHAPEHSDDFRRLYLARHLHRRRFPHDPPTIELAREGSAVEV